MAMTEAKKELPKEPQKMVLEQDPSGLWMYHRDASVGVPAIEKNGVSPGVTTREQAVRVVNQLHPGAFPEDEGKPKPKEDKPKE
jgi:hypothetical protein